MTPPALRDALESGRETFRYHWLKLRAVAHPTEDVARVRQAVAFVGGAPHPTAANEPDPILDTVMETHHGLSSHVLELTVARSRALRDVLVRLFEVPGLREAVRRTIESRTDDDGVLYVRLDKQEAYRGRLALTQGEDCVQLRLKMEAYPAGRAASLAALDRLLGSGRP